jgi:hypothetical protein
VWYDIHVVVYWITASTAADTGASSLALGGGADRCISSTSRKVGAEKGKGVDYEKEVIKAGLY